MYEAWAMIKDGVILNCVKMSDSDFKDPNYIWVKVEDLDPRPGPKWLYDGSQFIRPEGM